MVSAKYSLIPGGEAKKDTSTVPRSKNKAFDYTSAFNYGSVFSYKTKNDDQFRSAFDYGTSPRPSRKRVSNENSLKKKECCNLMGCITTFLTVFSYIMIAITFPITLWFCIKRLEQWERLILFRLGHLRGAMGPGFVFVIPWLDKHTRVDMRTKAFSVPPQQLITLDNGIIEMGCEVKYRVSDVQRLTTTITTPQHGLRSFGKTVMLNVLTKHTVKEMERDRLIIAAEVLKELNYRVVDWGIEIGEVDLSIVNVMKEAEPDNPLGPILSALGNSNNSSSHVASPPMGPGVPTASSKSPFIDFGAVAKMAKMAGFSIPGEKKEEQEQEQEQEHFVANDATAQAIASAPSTKLGRYLQNLVSGPGGADLGEGCYRLQVEGKEGGIYIIMVTDQARQVYEGDLPKLVPDVSVTITYEDLMSVLEGSLPPLQAYLSGRLSVQGNIQLLMGLESLQQENQSNGKDSFMV